ncbi:hypothetical protein TgHK011_006832 [Trichoderma gracile]|nr:hypothetical protein TgHK011_006832 [Trichoderma gracile]
MGKALNWQGDWKLTEKSHIAEAIWIAMLHPMNRMEICRKFVQVGLGDDIKALDVFYEIGVDEYGEEAWNTLKDSLKRLVIHPPDSTVMGVGAGGPVAQGFVADNKDPRMWDVNNPQLLCIHIIKAEKLQEATGLPYRALSSGDCQQWGTSDSIAQAD